MTGNHVDAVVLWIVVDSEVLVLPLPLPPLPPRPPRPDLGLLPRLPFVSSLLSVVAAAIASVAVVAAAAVAAVSVSPVGIVLVFTCVPGGISHSLVEEYVYVL